MTGELGTAKFAATTLIQVITSKLVPIAFDEQSTARSAIGRVAWGIMNVADVHMMQPGGQGSLARTNKRFRGRCWKIEHLEIGMERCEMQRHIRTEVADEPIAESRDFFLRIVVPGNKQGCDLKPDAGFMLEPAERIEHRLQFAEAQSVIKLSREPLQINVGGIHMGVKFSARLRVDISRRDSNRPNPPLVGCLRAVNGVFRKNNRIVVRKRDAAATGPRGRFGHHFGRRPTAQPVDSARLGNVPVLTKPAAEVASGRSEGQNTRTGIKVVERLLLNRIDAKTGSPPVAGQHHAFIVCLSNEAKAALIRTQFAFARAEVALDATVGKPVPPLSAHHTGFNFLTGKSWHCPSYENTG